MYSVNNQAWPTPPEGTGAGVFFPGRVAGAAARWQETDPGSTVRRTRLRRTVSGAETTRLDTGEDAELT